MAVKEVKQKHAEEVGVLPMPDSKASRNWWLVFGASCLLTFGTRLYKVNNPDIEASRFYCLNLG